MCERKSANCQTSLLNFFERTIVKKGSQSQTEIANTKKWSRDSCVSSTENTCPVHKRIESTPYAVDAFSYGYIKGVTVYFLSHYHYDHYCGLTPRFNKPVYCSKVTANLLKVCLKMPPQRVNSLSLNEFHALPDGAKVMLLDAHHCPGAVMFLFLLKDGRYVLHTGDLRADHQKINLRNVWENVQIDTLYLDTTYCNPSYIFPSQVEMVQETVRYVKRFLEQCPKTLICVGSYTIGKEKVFEAIANEMDYRIYGNSQKLQVLRCLDDKQLSCRLTTNPDDTRLHVISMNNMKFHVLEEYLGKFNRKYDFLLAIKPTGWEFKRSRRSCKEFNVTRKGSITITGVPYSEHSSFSELKTFVQTLKPKQVVPTVFNNATDLKQIKRQIDSWLTEATQTYLWNVAS